MLTGDGSYAWGSEAWVDQRHVPGTTPVDNASALIEAGAVPETLTINVNGIPSRTSNFEYNSSDNEYYLDPYAPHWSSYGNHQLRACVPGTSACVVISPPTSSGYFIAPTDTSSGYYTQPIRDYTTKASVIFYLPDSGFPVPFYVYYVPGVGLEYSLDKTW